MTRENEMQQFIVTVKLPKNPNHDPRNKQTGPCPVSGQPCDDVTGEHHSFLMGTSSTITVAEIRAIYAKTWHVTRVERVI